MTASSTASLTLATQAGYKTALVMDGGHRGTREMNDDNILSRIPGANREFTQRNPVASKRVLRALLKSADICATDPQRAARFLSDKLYEPRYQIGLNVMKGLPYNRWRDADPEATLRFHALRLHEAGMVKSEPNQLVARSTDWRFLSELKKELKT